MDGDGDDSGASETPRTPDPADEDASPTSVEQAKQPKPGERAPQYRGVDITGGKYGYGAQIDDALDATTNPDQFLFGFFFLCGLAIFAFLFGPRPRPITTGDTKLVAATPPEPRDDTVRW